LLDDPSNVSCKESTQQHAVDDSLLSVKSRLHRRSFRGWIRLEHSVTYCIVSRCAQRRPNAIGVMLDVEGA
jgi:hypothetical protein